MLHTEIQMEIKLCLYSLCTLEKIFIGPSLRFIGGFSTDFYFPIAVTSYRYQNFVNLNEINCIEKTLL